MLEHRGHRFSIEITSDKDRRVRLLGFAPRAVQSTVKRHVDSLKDITYLLAAQRQNAFHAKDIVPLFGQQLTQPVVKLF